MSGKNHKEIHFGRRDFIKTTALAGVAATLPGTGLAGQDTESPSEKRLKRKSLLCLSDSPEAYEQLIESIKAIPDTNLLVTSLKVDFQKPQEIIDTFCCLNADVLLLCISRFVFNFGNLGDDLDALNIPVIVLSSNKDVLLIDANLAASLRANGVHVRLALSQSQALELVKIAASPGILEDKKALLFGRPFDSTSVPARSLSEERVFNSTGVRVRYRPIEELAALLEDVDEGSARSEMQRWKSEAVEVVQVPDETILDSCRLYVLLRSIVDSEGLSAIGIDCLGFTLGPKLILPYPCLAFARLRDEGIAAVCEADVHAMLSMMFLQGICGKSSFMCNVNSLNVEESTVLLSHCAAPLSLRGANTAPMRYRLHDYHGFGRGVVPEVEFPVGTEVIAGSFTKDMKSFLLWPGRIQTQVKDTERSASPAGFTLDVCANTMDVKIRDADRFLQNIPGAHMIMLLGSHTKAIEDALFGMNVNIIGPSDFTPPDV